MAHNRIRMIKLLNIIILFPLLTIGQTRFYLLPDLTSDITPAVSASWTESASSMIRYMPVARISGTAYSPTISVNATTGTSSTLFSRHVSAPLASQLIAGSVKGQLRCLLSSTGVSIVTNTVVTVVNPAGTIMATLLPATSGTADLTGSTMNHMAPPSTAISSYTCATGDRIVVEIGLIRTGVTTARNGTMTYTSSQGSDLAEDNTSTGAANSWVEFSQTIKLNSGIVL